MSTQIERLQHTDFKIKMKRHKSMKETKNQRVEE